jgi:hypothetical protein
MQHEVNEFMQYVKHEMARGLEDWEQRLSTALVKSSPTDLVRSPVQPTSSPLTTSTSTSSSVADAKDSDQPARKRS